MRRWTWKHGVEVLQTVWKKGTGTFRERWDEEAESNVESYERGNALDGHHKDADEKDKTVEEDGVKWGDGFK